ncbi:MAG: undecaprenyl-diphosphate phosphatase, partial [Alphaproteobacteria bacterium]|nr:undecaprenyl-diphosphate phosphatase [Alphaproteobacteria bacterium]
MDIATIGDAVVLGVIEGLTEFIPVSSTGHLIFASDLLGFDPPYAKLFEIVIQLGAILAVCWLYRAKLIEVTMGVFSNPDDFRFARNVLLAFLPAVIIGVLAYGFIKRVLFSPWVVAVSLVVGGVAIFVIEALRPAPRHHVIDRFPVATCIGVGLCQTLAMIPGVSRAGATIMGAMLLGVDRKAATEFSFFLAIPTMLGATVYDSYKNAASFAGSNVWVIALGFVVAFIVAMFVVRWLIHYVSHSDFTPFGWYRIAVG